MAQQRGRDVRLATRTVGLSVLAILSAIVYGRITWLSTPFEFDAPLQQRPIITVVLLFTLAFGFYVAAIGVVGRLLGDAKEGSAKRTLWLIVGAAIVFRGIVFFSVPIQEVDVYRYVWDGLVCSQGISPFRYAPTQIETADSESTNDPVLRQLVRLCESDPAIAEVLHRVHFKELPTIYPATSQTVFCAAALTTPRDATLVTRLRVMKLWLLGFDLATLCLVIRLLQICRMPRELSVIYAWCPLVMKEVANSGHLDTIAAFLCTLAVLRLVATVGSDKGDKHVVIELTLAALVLALAVGAKLYPIVLAPLVSFVVIRRYGWRYVVLPGAVFVSVIAILLWPMLPTSQTRVVDPKAIDDGSPFIEVVDSTGVGEDELLTTQATDPSSGLRTFLKHWEMNDFIFMVIVENLKPTSVFPENADVWFSVVPDPIRSTIVGAVATWLRMPKDNVPFLITRAITGLGFLGLAIWWAWLASERRDARVICKYAFLTLAWFWLLCPTQNPWYWLWALPLMPFAQSRAWLAVGGMVMVYYLRFWFEYHASAPVLGTKYVGTAFFDFVVTWLEFAPWFVFLGLSCFGREDKNDSKL